MSLADLYKDGLSDNGSGSEGEEDEYVPDSLEENDETDGEQAEEPEDRPPELTEAQMQEKKRKIDSIWEEMNAPSERPAKAARPEAARPEPAAPQAENSRPQDDGKEVRRAAPRRRESKFSKIAEMVEQRRAKKENTLDKARREWSGFVAEQGIREDLDQANKDGFVERQEFLSRVNERTYERSRQK